MLDRHKRILLRQNPHWRDEALEAFEFKRDHYTQIMDNMPFPQIIALVGLRRVGKTVLIKQIMKERSQSVHKLNLGYISFDDKDFQKYEIADELINYFLTFSNTKKKRYLFLDEIQKIPNWPDLMKNLYDTEKNLKIIISGSSSLDMKEYRETLAGRIITIAMPIFTFREFVRYFGLKSTISAEGLMREYDLNFLVEKEKYSVLFESYLAKGAFPELLEISDDAFIKRYIKESIVEKVIADISRFIKPRREDIVNDMLVIFSRNTARLFEINNIANALNIDRNATANYINTLKSTYLIKVDYNYTKSAAKRTRLSKKAYIAHSSISLALLDYPLDITSVGGSDMGYLVETTIANSLDNTAFWRTSQKQEVDIIIQNSTPIPVEVKYREHIGKGDLKGILTFMEKFNVKKGVVVTKNILRKENVGDLVLFYIPAWLFLLIVPLEISKL